MRWNCPFCDHKQVVTEANKMVKNTSWLGTSDGRQGHFQVAATSITCQNSDCTEISLSVEIIPDDEWPLKVVGAWPLKWRLWPESNAKPIGDYIPESIQEDYYEACRIRELSPKASATLSRRALQGMIRNFAGIIGKTLYAEIEELAKQVADHSAPREIHPDSIEVIHAVRELGNIGAHMEKDVNHIIDVAPDESEALINLLEMLFRDWYDAREVRKRQKANLLGIVQQKKQAKAAPTKKETE